MTGELMIEYGTKEDTNEIETLFNICFPQEPEFNKWFFNNFFKVENTLVYRLNGEIAAMAQAIPCIHSFAGEITYIYGAGTRPEYRKKGLMGELLEFSFKEDLRKGKNASVLIPANNELFAFYEKFGYRAAFFKEDKTEEAKDYVSCDVDFMPVDGAEYAAVMNEIYNGALKSRGYILRNEDYFKIQIKMFTDLGGNAFVFMQKGRALGYCFVNSGEIPFVQEIITVNDDIYLRDAKAAMFKALASDKIRFASKEGNKPFGCVKYYNGVDLTAGYMGLMFD